MNGALCRNSDITVKATGSVVESSAEVSAKIHRRQCQRVTIQRLARFFGYYFLSIYFRSNTKTGFSCFFCFLSIVPFNHQQVFWCFFFFLGGGRKGGEVAVWQEGGLRDRPRLWHGGQFEGSSAIQTPWLGEAPIQCQPCRSWFRWFAKEVPPKASPKRPPHVVGCSF